jgi:hypothetical protein
VVTEPDQKRIGYLSERPLGEEGLLHSIFTVML